MTAQQHEAALLRVMQVSAKDTCAMLGIDPATLRKWEATADFKAEVDAIAKAKRDIALRKWEENMGPVWDALPDLISGLLGDATNMDIAPTVRHKARMDAIGLLHTERAEHSGDTSVRVPSLRMVVEDRTGDNRLRVVTGGNGQ